MEQQNKGYPQQPPQYYQPPEQGQAGQYYQQPYPQQPYYQPQPTPQAVYVQQTDQGRGADDALCLGCLAALCFCCAVDAIF